ncbi:unnamed protein product [Chrysoparadoxa australica]
MLDEFNVSKPAGFPDHPHRGFETVTYMLQGEVEHEDFKGHRGRIGPGDLQWMTAGRGIIHSEMPYGSTEAWGLQLWVNLGSPDKMCEPAYQELKREQIPEVTEAGVTARIIAGTALGTTSPVYTRTPVHYIHYKLKPNQRLEHMVEVGWTAFLYILHGNSSLISHSNYLSDAHNTVTTTADAGDGVLVTTHESEADFVLICGKPHNEPIVQQGPFVMNTKTEIQTAMMDYQASQNGFEGGRSWYSQVGSRG